MAYGLKEKICPNCEKVFVSAPYHSYRYGDKPKEILLCSHTCKIRYAEKMRLQKRKREDTSDK